MGTHTREMKLFLFLTISASGKRKRNFNNGSPLYISLGCPELDKPEYTVGEGFTCKGLKCRQADCIDGYVLAARRTKIKCKKKNNGSVYAWTGSLPGCILPNKCTGEPKIHKKDPVGIATMIILNAASNVQLDIIQNGK